LLRELPFETSFQEWDRKKNNAIASASAIAKATDIANAQKAADPPCELCGPRAHEKPAA
jgi:hypothetical protein